MGAGLDPSGDQPTAGVAPTADEYTTPVDRRARAADRQPGEICRYRHSSIGVLVPKSECARNHLDAISFGSFLVAACVSGYNVNAVCINMATAHLVARQQLHDAFDGQIA